jgi:hypothetical protein
MTLVRTDWQSKSEEEKVDIIKLAARITATHSDAAHLSSSVPVSYRFENSDETEQLNVFPFSSQKEIAKTCFYYRLSSRDDLAAMVEKTAR